ncbi:hypothetical protein ACK280_26265 [Mycobacterium sherrisii]|uniref:hypothetical protein n=1 Tax=Mycobacterium sherrisii TaxID=243061 RepID=UPI003977216F
MDDSSDALVVHWTLSQLGVGRVHRAQRPRDPLCDLLDHCARAARGDSGGGLDLFTTPF